VRNLIAQVPGVASRDRASGDRLADWYHVLMAVCWTIPVYLLMLAGLLDGRPRVRCAARQVTSDPDTVLPLCACHGCRGEVGPLTLKHAATGSVRTTRPPIPTVFAAGPPPACNRSNGHGRRTSGALRRSAGTQNSREAVRAWD